MAHCLQTGELLAAEGLTGSGSDAGAQALAHRFQKTRLAMKVGPQGQGHTQQAGKELSA
jgi:hypothetical protein